MKTFKDTKDREWTLSLNLGSAQRIEACDFSDITDRKISIVNMHAADCLDIMLKDPAVTFACIWCCIKPQADELGVTQEEFVESIGGSTLAAGREAWVAELADFFPELKTALLKLKAAQDKGLKKVQDRSNKMADTMTKQLDKDLDNHLNKLEKDLETGAMFG